MKTINGNELTIEDVCDVAYKNEEVQLPADRAFWERMEKSRKFLIDYINTGVPTYGVTTDFEIAVIIRLALTKRGNFSAL